MRLAPPSSTTRAAPTAAHYRRVALGLLAFTFYGALLPFHYTPMPLPEAVAAFRQITLWDPSDLAARGDWVVSIFQYAIVGYALMAAACCDRQWACDILAVLVVVPACAALAIGTEFLQIYFPPRTVSVNDIVVESAGGALGVSAWMVVGRRVTAWVRKLDGVTSLAGLAGHLLPAYVVALFVVELMPFDFVFSRDGLATKVADGMVRLVPFGGTMDLAAIGKGALTAAAFLPLGFLPVLARRPSRQPGTRLNRLGVVMLGPIFFEVVKLFVYSRSFDTTNILTGMVGVVVGWRLGLGVRTPALATWAAAPRLGILGPTLWLMWIGAVLYFNWRPFDFTADPARFAADSDELPAVGLRHMALAPFVDYYWNSKYSALDRFAFKGLSFVPGGVLLAFASRSIYRAWDGCRVVALAAGMAVGIEAGRYLLPSRGASVTDVMIQIAGAWLGFRLTQFVRGTLWGEAELYGWLQAPTVPLQFITSAPDVLPISHHLRR